MPRRCLLGNTGGCCWLLSNSQLWNLTTFCLFTRLPLALLPVDSWCNWKEIELGELVDPPENTNFIDCFLPFFPNAEQASTLKSLAQKCLLFSCPQQLNKIYLETAAHKSDCSKGLERAGLIIIWVQFLDKGLLYLTLVFFFFSWQGT